MFMDSMGKQTYQCGQHKLKLFTQHDSKNTQESMFFFKEIKFLGSHAVVLKYPLLL